MSDGEPDDPPEAVPVRIVEYESPYDGAWQGDARLTFDAWVYGILIVLTIVASIIY